MDFSHCSGAFCAASLLSISVIAYADGDSPVELSPDYQLRRLIAPTPAERIAENRGAIYIYDSLEATEVNAALDEHFDRIQNMMFIRIHHRPPAGGGGGLAEVEDDGCD